MKILFLLVTFTSLMITARAQRSASKFNCRVSHKHHRSKFSLALSETRPFEIGGQKLFASIEREEDHLEVMLKRVVTVLDADYQKEARRSYPLSSRSLPVELMHPFGGREDIFRMTCVPQGP